MSGKMGSLSKLPSVLFGYDSSAFTQKVRLALRLKQVPYTFVTVPSMMPRPILKDNFNITYRRIPVLAIGRDIYLDTAIILEALEHHYPKSSGYNTLYPPTASGNTLRPLIRGFTYYWTDKPFYRVNTGLIPGVVWQTSFGNDRAGLIGHRLDAAKLAAKVPRNLSGLDLHLSMVEPLLREQEWVFPTTEPSAADVALFYMLRWGTEISFGRGIENLTAGGTRDGIGEGNKVVFNSNRYPGVDAWFRRFGEYVEGLKEVETRVEGNGEALEGVLDNLKATKLIQEQNLLLPTPVDPLVELDERNGLGLGARVSIAPDDTGKENPQVGELLALGSEEIVVRPDGKQGRVGDVRLHFPRVAFVVRPAEGLTPKL